MLRNPFIKWSFIGLCFVLLVSCSKDEEAAPSTVISENILTANNGDALVECSKLIPIQGNINAKIRIVRSGTQVDLSSAKIRFTNDYSLQGKVLQFFTWQQDSSGNRYVDNRALTFDAVYNGNTFTNNALTLNDTAASRLNQIEFRLYNLPIENQVLQVVIFNQSDDQVAAYSDGLLPTYAAHPKNYNQSHQNQNLLQNLHPYKSEVSSTADQFTFAQRSYQDFCF